LRIEDVSVADETGILPAPSKKWCVAHSVLVALSFMRATICFGFCRHIHVVVIVPSC
jgi:hypothetical protein